MAGRPLTPEEINRAFREKVAEAQEWARQRFVEYYEWLGGKGKKQVTAPEPQVTAPEPEEVPEKPRRRLVIRPPIQ